MTQPQSYDYTRYLAAKRPIDERSRNRRVWQRFLDVLHQYPETLRILEVGGGLGATAERILASADGVDLQYTFVDIEEMNVACARENLQNWARTAGYACRNDGNTLHLQRPEQSAVIRFIVADAFDFAETADTRWHMLVAQAFLDLVNLRAVLKRLRKLLQPQAVLYLPLHFDGLTVFEPADDDSLNRRIIRAYHDTMDTRTTRHGPSGGSQTGRMLIPELRRLDATILASGSSDWVVMADPEGFSEPTRYFLYHILHFVESSVANHPDVGRSELDRWLTARRRQIEDGSLVFIAHQLDVLAQLNST